MSKHGLMEDVGMGDAMGEEGYKAGLDLAFNDIKDMNSDWRSVLPLARQMKREKGEQVRQGKELMFLDRGKVRLVFQSMEGEEKILWYAHDGCIFGEVPYFDPIPNECIFTCAADCVIYAFSEQALQRIGRERPDLILNLFQSMARKLRIVTYHASSLSVDDMLARICKFLSRRIVPGSSPLRAKIGISRQEMASLLGMHRISLYKVLRRQEELGLFGSIRGKSITILRPQEFYKLVEQ
ncbi:MAG: Crp/Fnr family transcriptional regulator [Deltaproteobacteria bacterium]|jgi:CRP-like cAMP-binding protein|nr:Crp/Fnr family transcriptional regulator [Deltaproteobacteria bacterium]